MSWVDDHRLHVIDPQTMSLEELNLFRTDLRNVLKFIKFSGDLKGLKKAVETDPGFQNMSREAVQMVNIYTNAGLRFEKTGRM